MNNAPELLTQSEIRAWDKFAAAALAGILADVNSPALRNMESAEHVADAAGFADLLLAERKKRYE